MPNSFIPNLIIGAGPAGLAVAGRMRQAGLDFTLLESSPNIANTWHHHYDRLHLHTVKQLSHLPHLEFPDDYPVYVSRKQLINYFENYVQHFDIQAQFGEKVTTVKKEENGHWKVSTEKGQIYSAERVVVATGVNRVPNVPTWEGQKDFKGAIVHSASYKNPQPFLGQQVLVIGMGNTGAELALDLAEHGVNTFISVRGPVNIVPRDLNGRPVQTTSKKLAKLPWGLGDWLGSKIRRFYFGDLSKYGLVTSKISPMVQLRETGKTPIVDIGTVKAIKAGKIKVMGDVKRFSAEEVVFQDGKSLPFDAVILATGYRAKVEDFVEKGGEMLDAFGCPKAVVAEGHHRGLYFVGFDNYKLGGILGTIYSDSETIVNHIRNL